ncbi:MAG: multiheme c-type cytochrome [Myxococcota bacterium]
MTSFVRPALAAALALLGGALALAGAPAPALFEGGARHLEVGPVPAGLGGTDAGSCAPCHDDIIAEWRGSLHAAAWTDPVFQAAYRVEPLAFCRNCHAPLHRGDRPSGVAASEGISCAVCHVRDGTILAGLAAARAPGDATGASADGAAPHPIRRVAALDDAGFCAPCHDFGFLAPAVAGHARVETDERQQSTASEWRALADGRDGAARATCQDCHMAPGGAAPGRPGHRGHAFPGRGDPAFVASALEAELSAAPRASDGAAVVVTARLTPTAVGHDVPTGDLFRRLELRVWPDGDERAAARLDYARSFTVPPGKARSEVADTRVGEPGAGERRLTVAAGSASVRRWRLDYLLMPPALAAEHHIAPAVNVMPLMSGTIEVPPAAP